jgi:hypothetical protein
MAKVKLRPEMRPPADCAADFFAWTQEQAQLLRDREARGLDWKNLAEEIDSMGRRDRRELESRLRLILHHLLKLQVQPELRSPSSRNTLTEQRRQSEKLLKESPSLRPPVAELCSEAYPDAVRDAVHETGLPQQIFPADCPSTAAQVSRLGLPAGGRCVVCEGSDGPPGSRC